jgi:hypothetical protein
MSYLIYQLRKQKFFITFSENEYIYISSLDHDKKWYSSA